MQEETSGSDDGFDMQTPSQVEALPFLQDEAGNRELEALQSKLGCFQLPKHIEPHLSLRARLRRNVSALGQNTREETQFRLTAQGLRLQPFFGVLIKLLYGGQ